MIGSPVQIDERLDSTTADSIEVRDLSVCDLRRRAQTLMRPGGRPRLHTQGMVSFPGSAWERTAGRLCLPVAQARGGASKTARSQAEPGNENTMAFQVRSP